MTIAMDKAAFDTALEGEGIVFVDFWAAWCGPCRSFGPIFEASAAKHTDLVFGKVDTEAQKSLAAAFDIRSIPTLAIFRDGILLYSEAGALPAVGLENIIEQVAKLDMEKVKNDLAEQERKHAGEKKAEA